MDVDRCRNCGAQLAEGAEWCNLCYTPVAVPAAETAAELAASAALAQVDPAPPAEPTMSAPGETTEDVAAPATTGATSVDGQPTDDPRLVWACPTCGEENPLDLGLCTVCGTPFAKLFEETAAITIEPAHAMRLGLLPGYGLTKVGESVEGLIRMIAAVLGVVMFGVFAMSGGGVARMILVILWLGFLAAIVAESAFSSRRVAEGGRVIIPGRQLMYIFATVFGLSIAIVVFVGVTARDQVI